MLTHEGIFGPLLFAESTRAFFIELQPGMFLSEHHSSTRSSFFSLSVFLFFVLCQSQNMPGRAAHQLRASVLLLLMQSLFVHQPFHETLISSYFQDLPAMPHSLLTLPDRAISCKGRLTQCSLLQIRNNLKGLHPV